MTDWFWMTSYLSMSILTALAFGIDKMAAKQGYRRISERTLHTLEFCCGWPGALVALHLFKHKRRKESYTRVLYAISALHLLLIMSIVIF